METGFKGTPGPWGYERYAQDAEMLEQLEKLGMEPTLKLTNDGQSMIMPSEERGGRVALVDIRCDCKRGQGHSTMCEEREANSIAIAAVPDMIAALEAILSGADPAAIAREALKKAGVQ